jgi:acyl carrier protein
MYESVTFKVHAIFSSVLGVPSAALHDTSSPDTIPNWDSLTHINLMLAIEEACGMRFEPDEIMELRTVGAIIDRVSRISG